MQRWRDILINFIIDLPSSNGFINIIVVINRFIKIQHIIPIVGIVICGTRPQQAKRSEAKGP